MTMIDYDVAILGGGPGGYTAALRAAQRGARVCLIEARHLGGTCLNVGCIPSKGLLHAGKVAYAARHMPELGLHAPPPAVDGSEVTDRIAEIVAELRRGLSQLLKARNVAVMEGHGRLTEPGTIHYTTDGGVQPVHATSVILATGSRPIRPDFAPWKSPRVMTTDEATVREGVPTSIIIVGGGVNGCELATAYAELGSQVVLVEQCDRLLPALEPELGRVVERSLKDRGVHVRLGTTVDQMLADDDAVITDLAIGQRVLTHTALIATGRSPNVEDIGIEKVGIEPVDGRIRVDDHCRTGADGVYAVGDVACEKAYAYVASRMGIIAADNATGHDAADDLAVVPECVYTHPELAAVGLSEAAAKDAGDSIKVAQFRLAASGMARVASETAGAAKLIAHQETGKLLGALLIGPHATELVGQMALAIRHGLTVADVAATIHAHPTFSETIYEAAEVWLGLPIHALR